MKRSACRTAGRSRARKLCAVRCEAREGCQGVCGRCADGERMRRRNVCSEAEKVWNEAVKQKRCVEKVCRIIAQ